jgi:hypothetical protein
MAQRKKKMGTVIVLMLILVAFFQLFWPLIYNSPSLAHLNPYPTQEYLQILGFISPNGLSAITVAIGFIALAWVAFTDP